MKLDGFRALARRRGPRVELLSRTGRSMGDQFPEIVAALLDVPGDWTLEAELVVRDERGHPSFEQVRRRALMRRQVTIAGAASETPAALCVFDVLSIGPRDLRSMPQAKRKEHLAALLPDIPGTQCVPWLKAHGEALFEKAVELDIEGVVAKRLDSPYRAGAQLAWLKIKNRRYSRGAVEFRR